MIFVTVPEHIEAMRKWIVEYYKTSGHTPEAANELCDLALIGLRTEREKTPVSEMTDTDLAILCAELMGHPWDGSVPIDGYIWCTEKESGRAFRYNPFEQSDAVFKLIEKFSISVSRYSGQWSVSTNQRSATEVIHSSLKKAVILSVCKYHKSIVKR